jgi:hypothetical protein
MHEHVDPTTTSGEIVRPGLRGSRVEQIDDVDVGFAP